MNRRSEERKYRWAHFTENINMKECQRPTVRKRVIAAIAALAAVVLLNGSAVPAADYQPQIFTVVDNSSVVPVEKEDALSELDRSGVSPEAEKTNTIMIYMVGTNLESKDGYGTDDLQEMMGSGFDDSRTNLLVFTGGCSGWQCDIPNSYIAVWHVTSGGMRRVTSNSSNSDMGMAETLADFVNFSTEYFPAQHYGLVLWDHGGGPLLSYGSDDFYASPAPGCGALE